MRPLVVYLDTSDFARLYRERCDPELAPVRSALLEKIEAGEIIVPLSFFVFFELLQESEPEFQEDRLRRARFIRRVCRLNAVPFIDGLLEGEALSIEGIWFPKGILTDFDIRVFKERLLTKIKSKPGLDRRKRRALSNSSNLKHFLRRDPSLLDWREIVREEDLPFSEEFVNGNWFRRYLLGEKTADDTNAVLRQTLTDPELLFRAWQKFGDKTNPLATMFDVSAMETKLQKLVAAAAQVNTAKAEYSKARRKYARALATSDLPPEIKAAFPPPGPKVTDLPRGLRDSMKSPVETELGAERYEMVWAYLESAIAGAAFQPSDLVDIAHAMYLPLCDLWRGDRKFSNALIERKVPHASKIVRSLLDIPARIDERLREAHK